MTFETKIPTGFNALFDLVLSYKIFLRKQNLLHHFYDVSDNIELANKNLLDIGGCSSFLSCYSDLIGDKKTICLEPESDGSSSGLINEFTNFKEAVRRELPVEQLPMTLQEFLQRKEREYDIVVLNNSISHLDEEACIKLREDKAWYAVYLDISTQLYNKMKKRGRLIFTSFSNKKFYHSIGMKSPFIKGIEWRKHQNPEIWIGLLEIIGFSNPNITWSSPNRFGNIGKVLLKNPCVPDLLRVISDWSSKNSGKLFAMITLTKTY